MSRRVLHACAFLCAHTPTGLSWKVYVEDGYGDVGEIFASIPRRALALLIDGHRRSATTAVMPRHSFLNLYVIISHLKPMQVLGFKICRFVTLPTAANLN